MDVRTESLPADVNQIHESQTIRCAPIASAHEDNDLHHSFTVSSGSDRPWMVHGSTGDKQYCAVLAKTMETKIAAHQYLN